jgi:hypothetical protein
MSMNPWWQLLGLALLIAAFALIHKSSRYADEDISPDKDFYHWEIKGMFPLSLMEEQCMPISKINVQQYLTPCQRNEFYINSMRVERKGATTNASNNKHSDGRTNVKAVNRIHSGFSAKG